MSDKAADRGRQGTQKPWEGPGQSSQDPAIRPPDRRDRDGRYEAPPAETPRPANAPGRRIEDRPTEDDLAQASLGGPKGSRELEPAPLTDAEREQMSPNDEPGHVA